MASFARCPFAAMRVLCLALELAGVKVYSFAQRVGHIQFFHWHLFVRIRTVEAVVDVYFYDCNQSQARKHAYASKNPCERFTLTTTALMRRFAPIDVLNIVCRGNKEHH